MVYKKSDIQKFAEALAFKTNNETQHLTEILANEYSIEAKAPALPNYSFKPNRRERRKLERERRKNKWN